jgi:hypothetical protein
MEFISMAQWMAKHIKTLEEKGILKKEDVTKSKQADSYLS